MHIQKNQSIPGNAPVNTNASSSARTTDVSASASAKSYWQDTSERARGLFDSICPSGSRSKLGKLQAQIDEFLKHQYGAAQDGFRAALAFLLGKVESVEAAILPGPPVHLATYPADRIGEVMMPDPTKNQSIPKNLRGVWWLRGIPLADIAMTTAGTSWDQDKHIDMVDVTRAGGWAWYPDQRGRALFDLVHGLGLQYEAKFDDKVEHGLVTPILHVAGRKIRVPESMAKFTMDLKSDGLWQRDSWVFGVIAKTYHFTRIVDENGQRDQAFNDYLKEAPSHFQIAQAEVEDKP